jgi:hypothetical protein
MGAYAGYWGPGGTPQPTNLLTKSQLAAQHPGTDYQSYVNYVTRTRQRRAAARSAAWNKGLGPLAAFMPPPGYYAQLAKQTYPIMSEEDMTTRAKSMISAQFDPIIKQITEANTAATQAGIDRISAYAKGAATDLQTIAPEISSAYNEALSQQNALDRQLAAGMGGAGKKAGKEAGGLADRIGVDSGSAAALSSLGAGAGNMEFGLGSASESQLISDRASNMAYAQKMPGISSLLGQTQVGDYSRSQALALQNQVGQLQAQIPGVTQSLIQDFLAQNTENRAAAAKMQTDAWSNALQAALGWQGVQTQRQQVAENWREAQLSAQVTREGQRLSAATSRYGTDVGAATDIKTTGMTTQSQQAIAAADNAAAWARAKLAASTKTAAGGGLTPAQFQTRLGVESGKMASNVRQTMVNRMIDVPNVNPAVQVSGYALRGQNWVPLNAQGKPIAQQNILPGTHKIKKPLANETAYKNIFQGLVAQFGGIVSPFTDKGKVWYAQQVAAIAGRGGYSKADPAAVLSVLTAKPAPAKKPAARAAAAATKPAAKPSYAQQTATKITADTARRQAFSAAGSYFQQKVSANEAFQTVYKLISDIEDPARTSIARNAVLRAYPTGTKITAPAVPTTKAPFKQGTGTLPQGVGVASAHRQANGNMVVRMNNGQVYERPPGGIWKRIK